MQEETDKQYDEYLSIVLDSVLNYDKNNESSKRNFKEVSYGYGYNRWGFSYVDEKGNPIDYLRYVGMSSFSEGFSSVTRMDGLHNYVNENGDYLWNEWKKLSSYSFKNGYAKIGNGKEYNFVNKNGDIISDKWFTEVHYFYNDYAWVRDKDNKWNVIDGNGQYVNEKGLELELLDLYKENYDVLSSWTSIDEMFPTKDGYVAFKRKDGKVNLFDIHENPIFKEWYDKIIVFPKDNKILVAKGDKWNYIDKNGNYTSKEWFSIGKRRVELNDGVIYVKDNKKQENVLTPTGDLLFDSWYDYADYYKDGYYRIYHDHKYNIFDSTGKPLLKKWVDDICRLDDYVYGIYDDEKYKFINIKDPDKIVNEYSVRFKCKMGNYFNDERYFKFLKNGNYILYRGDNGYILDHTGKELGVFKKIYKFHGDWAIATDMSDNKCVIDENGNILFNKEKDGWEVDKLFDDGQYGIVKKDGAQNYIDRNGNLISNEWFNSNCKLYPFNEGLAMVINKSTGYFNFLNTSGEMILEDGFEAATEFKAGVTFALKDSKIYIINKEGHIINMFSLNYESLQKKGLIYFKDGVLKLKSDVLYDIGSSFIEVHDPTTYTTTYSIYCKSFNLNGYEVKTKLIGDSYKCIKGEDKFTIDYEPLIIYDTNNILCLKESSVYLFNRLLGEYTKLGSHGEIEIKDNFIINNNTGTVLFVYEGNVIDITNYYRKNKLYYKNVTVNPNIKIITKNDYFFHNEETIKQIADLNKKEIEKQEEEKRKQEEQKKLEELQVKEEKEQRKKELHRLEAIRYIVTGVSALKKYNEENNTHERLPIEDIFITVNGVKIINPIFIETGLLKFVDLSIISFKNVKVSGVDFRGTNVYFNPQEVYNKDLSNCNFEGVSIMASANFSGVNVCGSKFTNDNYSSTFDINPGCFTFAIYDENTTLNGIPVQKLINDKDHGAKSA